MKKIMIALAQPAPPLSAPFSRCPVCRGTTSMDTVIINGLRLLCSVCHSCDSLWDLQGNPVKRGQVVVLPLVNEDQSFTFGLRGHGRAGRPHKRKEEL